MWSVEYVQVPEEKETVAAKCQGNKELADNKPEPASTATRKIARKMSRHESCDSYASEERSAADLLKDFKELDFLAVRDCELGSSGEQDSPLTQRMKQEATEAGGTAGAAESRGGNMSTTSSFSDLGGAEDWEASSVKSATASVDTGMDALTVLGEGSEADLESRGSKSEPCQSGVSDQQDMADGNSVSNGGQLSIN